MLHNMNQKFNSSSQSNEKAFSFLILMSLNIFFVQDQTIKGQQYIGRKHLKEKGFFNGISQKDMQIAIPIYFEATTKCTRKKSLHVFHKQSLICIAVSVVSQLALSWRHPKHVSFQFASRSLLDRISSAKLILSMILFFFTPRLIGQFADQAN